MTLDQLLPLLSTNGKRALANSEMVEDYAQQEREVINHKVRDGMIPDVGQDMAFARAQPRAQGDDDSGYKVVLWPSASYKGSVYVVREGGSLRILGATIYPRNLAGAGLEVLDRLAAGNLNGARTLLDWLRDDYHIPGGDDPMDGVAFPRMWTKGHDPDANAMRLAAASLLVIRKETAPQGLAILEAARNSPAAATEPSGVALSLLQGYARLDDFEKRLAAATELAKQFPESRSVFFDQSRSLRALGRFDEADRLAQVRLQRLPDDVDAMRAMIDNSVARGDYAAAHALGQKVIDGGKSDAQDLNGVAWHSLFTGKVVASDVEAALKSTELSSKSADTLHTLGCIYAEIGKTKEAREVLVQAMDSLGLDEPDENYWYAFGRIAEQYGEREAALADYARVARPKDIVDLPSSSYALAQIRLKAMHAGEQPSPQPSTPASSKK